MGADVFTAPAHRSVRELIGGLRRCRDRGPGREWVERLLGAAPNDNARMFLTRLAVESVEAPGADGEPDAKFADDVLARIEELAVSRQIAAVKSRLQRMNPVTEQTEYNRMFGDLVALEQRRKVLSERRPRASCEANVISSYLIRRSAKLPLGDNFQTARRQRY